MLLARGNVKKASILKEERHKEHKQNSLAVSCATSLKARAGWKINICSRGLDDKINPSTITLFGALLEGKCRDQLGNPHPSPKPALWSPSILTTAPAQH